ncbi:MAG TPA: UDP-N-acetylmuramoyl-tripeptide--D-alanyl-D-alanine ligase [Gemmatimonadales bacterium]|nr:UDP-N-acetylmuramoyl-tripeptide--D-alanyl-D-alanine ligase [Gemmatimonadales bacterium]
MAGTTLGFWTDARVREALGLPPAGAGGGGAPYTEISTDTRKLRPGALFVALKGERFDGHDHLEAARTAGATGAVVRRGTPAVPGLRLYEVEDTLVAYGRLARALRRAIPGPVVAVGGANGKTSTKEMCAAVLRARYRVHATPANDNNLVGIPQTILAAPPDAEALVIEAGASIRGELVRAREVIEPSIVITTNVAASHLDGFGSVAGVLEEELDLIRGADLAIVGPDPPELARRARQVARRVIVAGLEGGERCPERVTLDASGRPTLWVDGLAITLPLLGRHQAGNAMLAWTLGRELGVPPGEAARRLGCLVIPGGRGEVIERDGLTIVNDAYNANPASFRAAIATAAALRPGRRLVFVAGTMRELGNEADAHHAAIAQALVELEPDLLAAVGAFVPALEPYRSRLGNRLLTAPDAASLGPLLAARVRPGDLVVLKASRGEALERIIPHLTGQDYRTH